jgi:hypothetical protein
MNDYLVYHIVERMGGPVRQLCAVTNRRVSDEMVGSRIWIIQGEGGNPARFALGAWFVVDAIQRSGDADFEYEIVGRDGRILDTPIPLDDEPWFDAAYRRKKLFGHGLTKTQDVDLIEGLERLASLSGQRGRSSY